MRLISLLILFNFLLSFCLADETFHRSILFGNIDLEQTSRLFAHGIARWRLEFDHTTPTIMAHFRHDYRMSDSSTDHCLVILLTGKSNEDGFIMNRFARAIMELVAWENHHISERTREGRALAVNDILVSYVPGMPD